MRIKTLKQQLVISTVFAMLATLQSILAAYAASGLDGTGTHVSLYFLLSGSSSAANHIVFTITPTMAYTVSAFIYMMLYGFFTAMMIDHSKKMSKIGQSRSKPAFDAGFMNET